MRTCTSLALAALFMLAVAACTKQGEAAQKAAEAAGLEVGMDRGGGDYRDFDLDAPDATLCRNACQADPTCKAFSYVVPGAQSDKPRCWLKNTVPEKTANACCTSGVIAGR